MTEAFDVAYDAMCDAAHGKLTVDETYDAALALLVLALSKMDDWDRSATLEVIGIDIYDGLERLDALKARKKLNGHANGKGAA